MSFPSTQKNNKKINIKTTTTTTKTTTTTTPTHKPTTQNSKLKKFLKTKRKLHSLSVNVLYVIEKEVQTGDGIFFWTIFEINASDKR